MKKAAVLFGVLVLIAVGTGLFVLAARSGWMTPSDAELRARYRNPQSKFLIIDGQSLHYVDEGQGPPVVLVHGSYSSLRMWDAWAKVLSPNYRIIRFDRPAMGLSGPAPGGQYNAATEAKLIGDLATRLGIERFDLAATSSGGEAGAAFAAMHSDRVRGLILSNIAAGPMTSRPMLQPWRLQAALWADEYLGGWHMPMFWREILNINFADKTKVTPEMVCEWTDLNNRAQFYPRQSRPKGIQPFQRTPADLAAIRASTLLLWSDRDAEVPIEVDGRAALKRLGSADKNLVSVPNCGHMMPIECGPQSAVAAKAFLDSLRSPPS